MPKVLSINNVKLFFNTLPHVHANIFLTPCHGVSTMDPICPVVSFATILNHHLFQKLKFIKRYIYFNHLIITFIFPFTCGLELLFNT
jgi:hypothetical protein